MRRNTPWARRARAAQCACRPCAAGGAEWTSCVYARFGTSKRAGRDESGEERARARHRRTRRGAEEGCEWLCEEKQRSSRCLRLHPAKRLVDYTPHESESTSAARPLAPPPPHAARGAAPTATPTACLRAARSAHAALNLAQRCGRHRGARSARRRASTRLLLQPLPTCEEAALALRATAKHRSSRLGTLRERGLRSSRDRIAAPMRLLAAGAPQKPGRAASVPESAGNVRTTGGA
jgi:hypothetical protein